LRQAISREQATVLASSVATTTNHHQVL
jgi:hypothetical protein